MGGVDDLRQAKMRIARVRRVRMAVVAPALGIDDVAAQAHQIVVIFLEMERDRRDVKSSLDARVVSLVVILALGLSVVRACQNARERNTKHTQSDRNLPAHHDSSWCVTNLVAAIEEPFGF